MKFSEFLTDRTIYENGYRDQTPRASVVMPTYFRNAEGLLSGCIESVLNQTFEDFEFIIVDAGRGVLATLAENTSLSNLCDHGEALQLALQDGVSRSGDPTRGRGFHQLFLTVAGMNGYLRFRSGDAKLEIKGRDLKLLRAQVSQSVPFRGLLIAISCRV